MESKMGQCTKGNACSFRDDAKKRGKSTHSSSTATKPQTKSEGTILRKEETGVRLGRDIEGRAMSRQRQWEMHELFV